ncbi:long-chain-fatty-acid--CoA ligase [Sulfolobales archaeon HS-7]|nr:long-chain-fatty-acid--CoA ligase [Sulfolobales archaeon HS-7]
MRAFKFELTLEKVLNTGAETFPSQKIYYRDLREYTFSEFREKALALANSLRKLGVKRGDRVAVIDWDTDVYLLSYYGVPLSGGVLHTVNIRYPPELILKTMLHAEDRWIIVRDEFLPLLEKGKDYLKSVGLIAYSESKETPKSPLNPTNFWELLNEEPLNSPDVSENDMATIFYTSGTTGEPKGVWFTHKQLIYHAEAVALAGTRPPLNLNNNDVYMILVPMFHVHSWGHPYIFMMTGSAYVLPGRYDPKAELELIGKYNVTYSAMVPTILYMILSHEEVGKYVNHLKKWKVVIGGSALPEGLANTAKQMGITVIGGYGLSETCPVLTLGTYNAQVINEEEKVRFAEQITAGTPLPFVELKIVNSSMEPEKTGEIGEIVVRAPWTATEYFKDPEKTERLWAGGWLHTGDLGFLDKYGYLHIVDREKDAIKSGGEFIPSILLESAISSHPSVGQVAVIGKKDEKWGERPVAFIVPKGSISKEDLRNFLQNLAEQGKIQKWWIPDDFIFVQSLPLTSTNKIDKKELRKMTS